MQPLGLQHTRLQSVSQSLRKFMSIESVMLLTISSSAAPFSFFFCLSQHQGLFQLFASGGQRIGASALASILSMNIQGRFPLPLTGFDLLAVQGTLKSFLQHHSLKALILWCLSYFMVQFSHMYLTMENHRFDCTDLCQQNDVSAF